MTSETPEEEVQVQPRPAAAPASAATPKVRPPGDLTKEEAGVMQAELHAAHSSEIATYPLRDLSRHGTDENSPTGKSLKKKAASCTD